MTGRGLSLLSHHRLYSCVAPAEHQTLEREAPTRRRWLGLCASLYFCRAHHKKYLHSTPEPASVAARAPLTPRRSMLRKKAPVADVLAGSCSCPFAAAA